MYFKKHQFCYVVSLWDNDNYNKKSWFAIENQEWKSNIAIESIVSLDMTLFSVMSKLTRRELSLKWHIGALSVDQMGSIEHVPAQFWVWWAIAHSEWRCISIAFLVKNFPPTLTL